MKTILIIVLVCIFLFAILYFWGFTYAFRDFSGSPGYKQLKEYKFSDKKQIIEDKIEEIEKTNPGLISIADTGTRFTNGPWYTLTLNIPHDTTDYIFRFYGDSTTWNNEPDSEILLFIIENKDYHVTPSSLKTTDKNKLKEMYTHFETHFINKLRNFNTPAIND